MKKLILSFVLASSISSVYAFSVTDTQSIRAVQQALASKGLDPGPIDGISGAKTRAAIKEFQSREHLNANGALDSKTLDALGLKEVDGNIVRPEGFTDKVKSGAQAVGSGTKKAASKVKDALTGKH